LLVPPSESPLSARRVFDDATLTGNDAIIGGFHLSGPMFERIIEPTVDALAELSPSLLVPAHCTGWRAVHQLATRFPDAFVMSTVGTTIAL
jgi:7,8-dihydropterin-6-yl-methyl-4-(beta-D-ribofuranosyl)aminobenzene 5'-phosphate synthase